MDLVKGEQRRLKREVKQHRQQLAADVDQSITEMREEIRKLVRLKSRLLAGEEVDGQVWETADSIRGAAGALANRLRR